MQSTIKFATLVAAVAFLTTISGSLSAQTNRFSISLNSLTTNFNYGSSNAQLKDYKKNYSGLQAGFSYQAGITSIFSVVPELYFAMKGGTLNENNPLTGGKSTLKVNSLELPVLTRLHLNKLYINAGPYVGYNVGGRLKVDGTATIPEKTNRVSFGNAAGDLKRWDAGFQAGAGYNFNLKQSVLVLDVRYGYGLVSISQDVERYNRMLNISVQISKPGKKTAKQKQG